MVVFRVHSLRREGRAVRQLVALVEPISDMVAEHDRQQLRLAEDGATLAMVQLECTLESVLFDAI